MSSGHQTSVKDGPKKRSKARTLMFVLTIIAAIVALLFFMAPIYLSSDSGTAMLVGKVNDSIDGKVQIGDLSMGWFKEVELTDVSFADTAGTTSVNVKKVSANPKYSSLLAGRIDLGKMTIDEPEIVLTIEQQAATDDTTPEAEPAKPTVKTDTGAGPVGIPLERLALAVNNGNVTVNMKDASGQLQSVNFSNIESNFDIDPAGFDLDFDVAMDVEDDNGQAKITAEGRGTLDSKKWRLKAGSSGGLVIKIDNLELASLRPLLALAGQDIDARGKLNADIEAKIDDGKISKLTAQAVLADFKQVIDGKETVLTKPVTINAEVSSPEDTPRLDKLTLKSSFCTIDCTGDAETMQYNATADLEGVQDFAQQLVDFGANKLQGSLTANGNVTFGDAGITAKGSSSLDGLVVNMTETGKSASISSTTLSHDISIDKDQTVVNIASVDIKVGPGIVAVKVTNSIWPLQESSQEKLMLSVLADADLAQLKPFAETFELIPADMEIAGLLKSDIKASGSPKVMRITTDNTTITNLMVKQTGKEDVFTDDSVNLIADMVLDTEEKAYEINDLRLDSTYIDIPKGRISRKKAADRTEVDGEFVVAYDHGQLSKLLAAYLPEDLTIEGKRESTITFETSYGTEETGENEFMANMNAKASVGFDKVSYMGIVAGKTDVDLSIDDGVLDIGPIATKVNDGNFNFAGKIDFNEKIPTLKMVGPAKTFDNIDINDEMSEKILKYANPIFANQMNVKGILNLETEKLEIPFSDNVTNDMEIIGTLSMDEVRLSSIGLLGKIVRFAGGKGQLLSIEPTKFVVKDGEFSYDKMQVDIGDNPVVFAGTVGFDNMVDMTVTTPYTITGETVKVGQETAGRLVLSVKGPLDNLVIDIFEGVGKTIEGLLGGLFKGKDDKKNDDSSDEVKEDDKGPSLEKQLEEEIRKGLEGLFKQRDDKKDDDSSSDTKDDEKDSSLEKQLAEDIIKGLEGLFK